MAVSGDKIKTLRDAKAWSQAHLAEAAGLSLRTVQRVEAEGTASAETRLAIAAALGVSVEDLSAPAAVVAETPDRLYPGPVNTLVMLCTFGTALVYALWLGGRLPAQVASHFGVAGDANGHMSRDAFAAGMCVLMAGAPLLMWVSIGHAVNRQKVKIPNASYWFAGPRRVATVRFLFTHFTWFGVLLTVFLGHVFWLVAAANAGAPSDPVLEPKQMFVALGAFLAAVAVWVTVLNLRFRREAA